MFRPSNKFNLDPRFFQSKFCKIFSNTVMELVITNFQISAKRISMRNITIRDYRQLVIVIVEQRCIISELWTVDWKVLILSSTLLMQIYMHCVYKTFLYFRSMHHFGRELFLYVFTFRLSLCECAYPIALMLLRHYHIHTNTLSLC